MNGVEYYDFEDIKMPVMTGYHSYLVREFGDNYMTPPKEEDRRPLHLQMKYKMK
jgi:phosphorylcholine metabolism protein LicD